MGRRLLLLAVLAAAGCDKESAPAAPSGPAVSFFVTSTTSTTGNLGGLSAADATCQALAVAAGHFGDWRAYLSAERDPERGQTVHARDRIGTGPWYTANGVLVASNLTELHGRAGDASVFVDERGRRINGQWTNSPRPNEHDILTGTNADGTLAAGRTCADWTSEAPGVQSQVGHSDGFGPNQNTSGTFSSWNAAHTGQCANTAPGGGAGRFYCFAR